MSFDPVGESGSVGATQGLGDKLDANLAGLITAPPSEAGASTTLATGDHALSDVSDPSASLATQASDGFVTVDTTATDGDGATLLGQLEAIGLQHGNSYGAVASGLLPVANVSALPGVADLEFAQEAASQAGAAQVPPQFSNGVRAGVARSSSGFDGTGVTVGILSDSFNEADDTVPGTTTKDDMAYDIANGDLPQNTRILNDDPSSTSATDEGRAMAQIVHQVAPGASILFDTAEGGQASFAQHILDLAAAGAKIIVDDESYFAEPDYQDGVIAQAIETVEAKGVTYLSSAGNDGSNGYEGAFKADRTFTYDNKAYTADQFGAAGGTAGDTLPIAIGPLGAGRSETIDFELQWNQPYASASPGHGATGNLDLFLTDGSGTIVDGLATQTNNVGGDPSDVLAITFTNNGSTTATFAYGLKVGLSNGTAPTDLRIVAAGDGVPVSIGAEASNTDAGTLVGHHGQGGSSAVGAVYYGNSPANPTYTSAPVNETYSSAGVDDVDYADDGTPLTTPRVDTVAFSGIDGGNTSFFSPGNDGDGDGLPNFYGTSAAAPSAAAVAALMLQTNPSLTPAQIQQALAQSATPTSSGARVGGTGLIQADVAVASVLPDIAPTASIPQTYETTTGQVLNLRNTGIAVADPDGGSTDETATLTVNEGTLVGTPGSSGASILGTGMNTLTITGTVAQIDAYLASSTDTTATLGYSGTGATPSRSSLARLVDRRRGRGPPRRAEDQLGVVDHHGHTADVDALARPDADADTHRDSDPGAVSRSHTDPDPDAHADPHTGADRRAVGLRVVRSRRQLQPRRLHPDRTRVQHRRGRQRHDLGHARRWDGRDARHRDGRPRRRLRPRRRHRASPAGRHHGDRDGQGRRHRVSPGRLLAPRRHPIGRLPRSAGELHGGRGGRGRGRPVQGERIADGHPLGIGAELRVVPRRHGREQRSARLDLRLRPGTRDTGTTRSTCSASTVPATTR